MKSCVIVLALCAIGAIQAVQDSSYDSVGVRVALKLYDECSNSEGYSPCLKKKAITFLDRLSRMDKFTLVEGVTVLRSEDSNVSEPVVNEEQLDTHLPRSVDAKDEALTEMLFEKIGKFVGSRTIEVSMPKMGDFGLEEGRGKGGGGGGSGGGGGGKGGMKGMMSGMMMGIAAKMAALIPLAIAGLFLLAGKALITAKIALLISGIIAIKKLFASKQGGGGGGHGGGGGGWQSGGGGGGGHGGGWQSGGGGWDKRSIDDVQHLAYNSYAPK